MKYIIFLDDGHGIKTPGKRTPPFEDGSYMKENEFNSAVVTLIKDKLNKIPNVEVILTAPTDEDVSLKQRADTANNMLTQKLNIYGYDNVKSVFVSVHANAMKGYWGTWGGIETYYYRKGADFSTNGKKFAEILQKYLLKGYTLADRKVKGANFSVLRNTIMTAALVECGFMDNKEEATLLMSADYREECAEEIADAIIEFLQIPKPIINQNLSKEEIIKRLDELIELIVKLQKEV